MSSRRGTAKGKSPRQKSPMKAATAAGIASAVKKLMDARRVSFGSRPKRGPRSRPKSAVSTFSRPVQAPVSSTSTYTAPVRAANQVVSHTEYLTDLVTSPTSGAFSTPFIQPINPGNATLFPWLSQIAQAYEQYEILELEFLYRKLSPSTLQGLALMAIQYDSYDGAFSTKAEMQDYAGARSTAVWNDLAIKADVKQFHQRQKLLYVLPPGATPSGDAREYYAGLFTAATSNVPTDGTNALNVGEILVRYKIRFSKPLLSSVSGAGPLAEQEIHQPVGPTTSDQPLIGAGGVLNFDSNSPLSFSATGLFPSGGAAQVKAAKWLLSTLYDGALSASPAFTLPTHIMNDQNGVTVTDISDQVLPVFYSGGNDVLDIRHFALDFSKVDEKYFQPARDLIEIHGPSWSSGGVSSSKTAALLTKITNTAYQNLIGPLRPGTPYSAERDPVLRHLRVLRAPSSSYERMKLRVADKHDLKSVQIFVPRALSGPKPTRQKEPVEEKRVAEPAELELQEDGFVRLDRPVLRRVAQAPPTSKPASLKG